MRILGQEATLRFLRLCESGEQPPPRISEHKERMDTFRAALERYDKEQLGIYEDEIDILTQLRLEYDSIAIDWSEGKRLLRWCDFFDAENVTAEDIVFSCVYRTESVYRNHGVEVVAAYLDAMGGNAVLQRLSEQFVASMRDFIDDHRALTKEENAALRDPCTFFGTHDYDAIRRHVTRYFHEFLADASPAAAYALIAHTELALKHYLRAISNAEKAYCEWAVRDFVQDLHGHAIAATSVLLDAEQKKAEILLTLLRT